ncbi:MAG: universal stress protein [Bacteroidetes bacterium]|nr:universal stress protein [Bacteroidota bacterium]
MKKVFVATDFSAVAKNAVVYAAEIAKQFNSSLSIIHIYESPLFYTAEMPYTAIEAAEKMAKADADQKMEKLYQDIVKLYPEIKISAITKRGVSADSISEAADAEGADLLISGSTGAGVVERTLIGSTTTALINKTKCMVLIVPEKAKFTGIKSLVYATDLNEKNIESANSLLPIAHSSNAELIFLFVDNKIHTDSEKISEEMAEKIRSHVKYAKTSGYVCTDPDIMNGISLFIHKKKADLVAMVTHRRSFPRMLWDKSLTKKFSYHPEIPLLVIHAAE